MRVLSKCNYHLSLINLIMFVIADINECVTNNGNCSHQCINTVGFYLCRCKRGFNLDSNGHSCTGQLSVKKEDFESLLMTGCSGRASD